MPKAKIALFSVPLKDKPKAIDHRWILIARRLQNFRIFVVMISAKILTTFSVLDPASGLDPWRRLKQTKRIVSSGDENDCKRKKGTLSAGASPYSPLK